MPTETPTNKANAEVETLPLKAEMQIRKFKDLHTFSCFFAHQIIMFYFFLKIFFSKKFFVSSIL